MLIEPADVDVMKYREAFDQAKILGQKGDFVRESLVKHAQKRAFACAAAANQRHNFVAAQGQIKRPKHGLIPVTTGQPVQMEVGHHSMRPISLPTLRMGS